MVKKYSITFILSFFIFIDSILGFSILIPIDPIKQKRDFCGEASVAIMLNHIGYDYSQEYVHNSLFGLKNIDRGAYSIEIFENLKNKGYIIRGNYNYSFNTSSGLKQDYFMKIIKKIKRFLDRGYPVFINWFVLDKKENKHKPHFSLIIGYTKKDKLLIYDPRWNYKILKIKISKFKEQFLIPTVDNSKWGYCYFIIEGKL